MRKSVTEWPISQLCNEEIPDKRGTIMNCKVHDASTLDISMIVIYRCSSYNKLLRVTSRILSVSQNKSFKGLSEFPTATSIKEAENNWVKEVQKQLPSDWQTKNKRLAFMNCDGIVMVGQRIAD